MLYTPLGNNCYIYILKRLFYSLIAVHLFLKSVSNQLTNVFFSCCSRAHVRDSRSCKQAVFTQSNTCAKPPVYSNRAVLTGFCGDISSIQEGQSILSTTTEADKSKPEKDNVLA